ncbi:hypothetical protein [Planotetraspora kaengkrachanensis]|uniref:Uncharacterized protein n=1 Tax=Planotetraspora kaengkrachanensis TaxID=575193 RepID=A0A8J3PT78_9ACTN|nr:hypothetical protein [Planotetraspora kaengkrachanensis]GIG79983.1 hypothetical protein Pka01_31100 [Planotetraspora kaengkrachanensis]
MAHDKAPLEPVIPGWRIMHSDAGRFWATRSSSFDGKAEKAGAARTVDGDDLMQLAQAIAEQESIAATATS